MWSFISIWEFGYNRTLKSHRLRWAGHVAWMGDWRREHKFLLGKPDGKRPRGRSKINWEDNIIWDLKEVDYDDNWKILAQDNVIWCASVLAAFGFHNANDLVM